MTEKVNPNGISWPEYFQPRPGQEAAPSGEFLRIPTDVVDIFYLRETPRGATHLITVTRCPGGTLGVFTEDELTTLPDSVQNQVQAARVNGRNRFRGVTANVLYLFTPEVFQQNVSVRGYNDAVYLYGRMQTRLHFQFGKLQRMYLQNEGQMTVGRLDLMYAVKSAHEEAFDNPATKGETYHHLLVPGSPVDVIQKGFGLALVYPTMDSQMRDRPDNSIVLKRVAYELLFQLQQDLLAENANHPFTTLNLPVPSRARLEAELESNGYEIDGDVAVKMTQQGAAKDSWLARLQAKVESWSAPKIPLPNEAALEDYVALITQILPEVGTANDKDAWSVLSKIVEANTAHRDKPEPVPVAPVITVPTPRPTIPIVPRPEPSKPKAPPKKRLQSVRPASPRTDWAADFAAVTPPATPINTQEWWQDFASSTHGGSVISNSDWAADFEAASHKPKTKQTEPTVKPKKKKTEPDYSADFEPIQPRKPKTDDWTNDFEA